MTRSHPAAQEGGPAVTTLVVPHEASSVREVRHRMCTELLCRGVPGEVVDDAALVVSELVGNAVRHGAPLADGGVQVSWEVTEQGVLLECCDGGGGPPGVLPDAGHRPSSALSAEGGRGLAIVSSVSVRWGTSVRADGVTCVTAELRVPAVGESAETG